MLNDRRSLFIAEQYMLDEDEVDPWFVEAWGNHTPIELEFNAYCGL